jgi:cell volume regulation protein A
MGSELLFLGVLVFAANFFAMLFSKKKIPDVLFLILVGIILGPVLKLVTPNSFGKAGTIFTTITLIFILFEGGIGIKFEDLKKSLKSTLSLTLMSVVLSIFIAAIVCNSFHLTLLNSFIVGCILCGTAATVVIPLTQHLNIGNSSKIVLILESAVSDVICLILSLSLIDAAKMGTSLNFGKIAGSILASFTFAVIIGIFGAIIWGMLLKRLRRFKNSMFLTPASVFIVYGITDILGFSGAIAAISFGICIANMENMPKKITKKYKLNNAPSLNENEKNFISEIGFLLKTVFFVYVGISIPFNNMNSLVIGIIITLILLIQRVIVAKYCSPKDSNVFDKSIIALIIPKGLAAAVVASIPEQLGLYGGTQIKEITYAVVLFSILICSLLVFVIEKYPRFNLFLRWYFGKNKTFSKIKMPKKLTEQINKLKDDNTFFDQDEESKENADENKEI